ncbi:MAG TPA: hypothetical protein VFJ97_07555 [Dermatophilaceae bacterium]|nr:hypothetical protein [Dermatophilaceae bacterium]
MIIDCATCPVRGKRCADCVVGVLYDPRPAMVPPDAAERRALAALVAASMVTAEYAATVQARRQPWNGARAVG